MTEGQIRAARVLLGMSQPQLADLVGISTMTLKRAEGAGSPKASEAARASIRKALEAEGIQFLDTGEVAKGSGVVLKDDS